VPHATQPSVDAPRLLLHWRQEMDGAALFDGLAALERHPRRRAAYRRLAAVERDHADGLSAELRRGAAPPPPFRPSWRTRGLLALARRFGTAAVLPRVARLERADARRYRADARRVAGAGAAWWPTEEEEANAAWLAEFAAHEASEASKRWLLRFRRSVLGSVGAALFLVSLLLMRNAQIEGLWFGLLTGVALGPVAHYALGKVLLPIGLGRVWCGWACWTAALVDQLPYRQAPGWRCSEAGRHPLRDPRSLHAAASLALVAIAVFGFGAADGAVGPRAALWFAAGNALYWGLAVGLAVAFRDNRAFCKYLCPVAVLLRVTARPALLKVGGDAEACRSCASRACIGQCPMGIRIPDYVAAGRRVLATECIQCLQCVAVCPPNTLAPTVGFDLGGLDLLEPAGARRPAGSARRAGPLDAG
jgi:ferredoxin-type protein NapH